MDKLDLCKIAVEVGEHEGINGIAATKYFQFEKSCWRLLPHIQLDKELILGILNNIKECNTFFSVEIKNEHEKNNYLYICAHAGWDSSATRIKNALAQQVFPILFRNYDKNLDSHIENQIASSDANVDRNEKLIKRYVTTKLYDVLYKKHQDSDDDLSIIPLELPKCFVPVLYNYQKQTVRWLLMREQIVGHLPSFYVKLNSIDNLSTVYKHVFCTVLFKHEPTAVKLAPGGILADEMGLGKTVEMLALILLHKRSGIATFYGPDQCKPGKRIRLENEIFCICNNQSSDKKQAWRKLVQCTKCELWQHDACVNKYGVGKEDDNNDGNDNEPYYCPSCWADLTKGRLVESGTTFIVSPHMIKMQWYSEIKRHINPMFRVLLYEGVSNKHWISPRELAKYDVVLTDYTVLRNELYYSSTFVPERVMRNKPQSMRVQTPLLMLNWWRVCLDEAQMVESNASNTAKLVRMLPAINRWAVTGTPIHRTIDDLQSLLHFIGVEELQHSDVWNKLVSEFLANHDKPSKNLLLVDVLQKCMWRTGKSNIVHELKLPPQTELVHRIDLSNLERLFYVEQHSECQNEFLEKLRKHTDLSAHRRTISPKIMKFILQPLLKIRQCCNMPVVEDKQRNASSNKQFMHPTELHQHLISSNENQCKVQLRFIASAFNGIAALYSLRGSCQDAIKYYELVLKLAADYNDKSISVDSLLQIHALHNMIEAYSASPDLAMKLSCDVEDYKKRLNELEWKYLQSNAQILDQARMAAEESSDAYSESVSAVKSPLMEFVAELTEIIMHDSDEMQTLLINKIRFECHDAYVKLEGVHSMRGVLYILALWFDKVTTTRTKLITLFGKLKYFYENIRIKSEVQPSIYKKICEFTARVYDCHLREVREEYGMNGKLILAKQDKKNACELCVINQQLKELESLLFDRSMDRDGLEIPSFEFSAINVILNFAKFKQRKDLVMDIAKHKHAMHNLNLLCKRLIKFWIELEYTVKTYDELDMCKMRIRLTKDVTQTNSFRILESEIDEVMENQRVNLRIAEHEFSVKMGRLRYIKYLQNNFEQEPCPICNLENAEQYTVLECGHRMCLLCMRTVNQYYKSAFTNITCPICRHQQSSKTVYYVTRVVANENIDINGVYSSKIMYILRLVKKLMTEECDTIEAPLRILIFSQWQPILNALSVALTENEVKNIRQCTPEAIEKFKDPNLGIICLLMPLSKGSKGLNLIEATHVFLVEPILNPGEELQAIGRVHRFGQTRTTTVHRFIVNKTIEDNVFQLVSTGKKSQENWDFDNVSLEALRNLFVLQNDTGLSNELDNGEENP